MSRPKSEEKRLGLLLAAAAAVAERGVAAPTALIAKRAGVAEGTLFRYFPSKEALLNEVYLFNYRLLTTATRASFDRADPLQQRAHAVWNSYIDWGLANPVGYRAISQLAVTDILTVETRAEEARLFPDAGLRESFTTNEIFEGLPQLFADTILVAVADATVKFAAEYPERTNEYKLRGFRAFWRMVEQ